MVISVTSDGAVGLAGGVGSSSKSNAVVPMSAALEESLELGQGEDEHEDEDDAEAARARVIEARRVSFCANTLIGQSHVLK